MNLVMNILDYYSKNYYGILVFLMIIPQNRI